MRNQPELPGLGAFAALALLGVITFAVPLARAGFVNFDDNLFFGPDNAAFAAAWDEGDLRAILDPARPIANAYLPVAHLSLWIDYAASRALGFGPRFAHLHGLLLHVLAGFALARLLGRLGLGARGATAAAALFLVHPALVESVAWVSSRKDVLSGLFAFLCLSAVARDAAAPKLASCALAALWALLALYAKGTAVVLAGLAPLVGWLVASGHRRELRRWRAALAVAALALAAGLHHAAVATAEGTLQPAAGAARLAAVPGALLHYLTTAVWPSSLNVLYPEAKTLASFRAALVPGVVVLVAAAAAAFVAARRGRPKVAAGLALAGIAWLPFNTAWPASAIAAADRYLYLVVPWLALAAAAAAGPRVWPWLGAAAVVPLALMAHTRARAFESSTALWQSSLTADADNAVAALNLAKCLIASEPERARELAAAAAAAARHPMHRVHAAELQRDLALRAAQLGPALQHAAEAAVAAGDLPDGAEARAWRLRTLLKLATLRLAQGQLAEGRSAFDAARALAPDHPGVLTYEASLLLATAAEAADHEDRDAATRHAGALLERALAAAPDDFDALVVRARCDALRGELMSALRHNLRARAVDQSRPESYLGEADLWIAQADFAAAERTVRAGIAAGASDPNLLVRLGVALTGQGKLADARAYYERYLAVSPHDAGVRRSLAAVIATEAMRELYQRSPDALDAAAARVLELDPLNPKALLIRGLAERLRRRLDAALVLLEQAYAAMPDSADARRLLAETHRDRGYELLRQSSPPPEAALDHFRAFVDCAPPGLDTGAALDILRGQWTVWEQRGVDAHQSGDLEAAERAFRRCLFLLPDEASARFQLGMTVLGRGAHRLDEALACFEAAEAGQRAHRQDAALPVLYQVLTLQQLGRAEEAAARGQRYLDTATFAHTAVLQRIRAAIDRD